MWGLSEVKSGKVLESKLESAVAFLLSLRESLELSF